MIDAKILQKIRDQVPNLLAIYAFGSHITGHQNSASDLDLAILVEGYATPVMLWNLSGELADIAQCPVDLLDIRAASTVMQSQIFTTGQRLWAKDSAAALFEAAMLNEKIELDAARAGLIADIQSQGMIYGR